MRCHKCNQDNIKIKEGHIYCDICGLDIDGGQFCLEDDIYDLFIYNEELSASEKLGRESCEEGKKVSDNPYTDSSDQISMKVSWHKGWNSENIIYENSGLSLLAEKLKIEIDRLNKQIEVEDKEKVKSTKKYEELKKKIKVLNNKSYILPWRYNKDLRVIVGNLDE